MGSIIRAIAAAILVGAPCALAAPLQEPVIVYRDDTQDFTISVGGDVDGDGRAEVFSWTLSDTAATGVTMVRGRELGSGEHKRIDLGGYVDGSAFAVGDLNNDGNPDLVASVVYPSDGQPRLVTMVNVGQGRFPYKYERSGYGDSPWLIQLIDFDHDGFLDVVGRSAEGISMFRNRLAGEFGDPVRVVVDPTTQYFVMSDLDGDGDLDLLLSHGSCCSGGAPLSVMLGDGAGGFGAETYVPFVPRNVQSTAFADLDGDGDQDAVVFFQNTGTLPASLGAYRNDSGSFVALPLSQVDLNAQGFALGDLDQDGRIDAVMSSQDGQLFVHAGSGLAGSRAFAPFGEEVRYDSGTSGGPVHIADVDGDGFADALVGGRGKSTVVPTTGPMAAGGGAFDPALFAMLALALAMSASARRRLPFSAGSAPRR